MLTRLLLAHSLALCLVATGTGCGGRGVIAGGAMIATAGAMITYSAANNSSSCSAGDNSCMFVDSVVREPVDNMVEAFGITTIVIGAGLMLAGAIKVGTETQEAPPRIPILAVGPPGGSGQIEASLAAVPMPHAATPAERAIRARPENQLALQITTIARAGHCDAARLTGERLRAIDPDLYRTLAKTDAAFANCLARAALAR